MNTTPTAAATAANTTTEVHLQDRYLPIANLNRILKRGLPPNAKVTKDAKEAIQESVSEFISFVTSEASDKCIQEKRKTINGDDLLWAMGTLGFEHYIEPLRLYLVKYRDATKDTNNKHHKDKDNNNDSDDDIPMEKPTLTKKQQQQLLLLQQQQQQNNNNTPTNTTTTTTATGSGRRKEKEKSV